MSTVFYKKIAKTKLENSNKIWIHFDFEGRFINLNKWESNKYPPFLSIQAMYL